MKYGAPSDPSQRTTLRIVMVLLACWVLLTTATQTSRVDAQEADGEPTDAERKVGYVIEVPPGLGNSENKGAGDDAGRLVARLERLAQNTRAGQRTTVLLDLMADEDNARETAFEEALVVARAMGQSDLRRLRLVTLVSGPVADHRALLVAASEQLLVTPAGSLASIEDRSVDETVVLTYQAIAKRRGILPPSVVNGLLQDDATMAFVTKVNGEQQLLEGESLEAARAEGVVLREDIWKRAGTPMLLTANQLREARFAAAVVQSRDEASNVLDLAELRELGSGSSSGPAVGSLLEVKGSIASHRVRRWQSNLSASAASGDVNTWLIEIDSNGGELDESAALAASLAFAETPIQTVAGLVTGEARGDAALIAIACKPLMMLPDATLGGPGAQAIGPGDVRRQDELLEEICRETNRPLALVQGLLDPTLKVFRYTDRRTGRVRYATPDQIAAEDDQRFGQADGEQELTRWEQGEAIELGQGIDAATAISLGLADAPVDSLEKAARAIELGDVPPAIADRPIIRWVEKIGRSNSLMFLLLMVGFFALSAEAGAPGLGVPGFISMVCFALFFWMKFLAGTAEWLELIALGLGLLCIAIEVFVIPGVGIFGIGGIILTVVGIVLMSQTFVIPRNAYQIEILTRGIWLALSGMLGLVGGFIAIRTLMPHVPLLNQLVMESDDASLRDKHERLADYEDLIGQVGVTTTVLRPSGKAKFGDRIVGVVSDGSAADVGTRVRVREVQGTRIVVEIVSF